jgi:serine/threonine protein kinase
VSRSILQPLRRWDPDRIGRYTIIGKLGAGAMGQVYLARSAAGRLVAVKTIRVELAEEPGFRGRFAREVAAASRVSGVYTAAVIEADPNADLPWVATAYVPAPSLAALVRQCGPLPAPAVNWLAAGCAEALQSIHSAGLLHRDVKPSNVLVSPDGPRVIDFGVARAAERVQLTAAGGAAGTPSYMAPEVARDATQASPAGDIFSLGATLVYAATGHPPYQGETTMDILVRLATEPPDLADLPAELHELVASCLERVPRERPSDADILAGLGSFALPDGPHHSYLPDAAMTLIAQYQHSPLLVTGVAGDGEEGEEFAGDGDTDDTGDPEVSDATSGSHTALPGFESLAAFRAGERRSAQASESADAGQAAEHSAGAGDGTDAEAGAGVRASARAGRGARAGARGARGGAGAWDSAGAGVRPQVAARGRVVGWPVLAGAAVLLLAAGTGLGIELHGSPAQALGPLTVSTCGPPAQPATTPQLCVSQPWGDGYTVFVIHGNGYQPFTQVTVKLNRAGVSSAQVTTDRQGSFNYAIDQGHYFFKGLIPPGTYQVTVTGQGEQSVSASFRVYAAGTAPPPPGLGSVPGPP